MGAGASIGDDLSNEDMGLREKLKAELFQSDCAPTPAALASAFRKFDQNHDDILSNDEFRMVLSELGCDLDQQEVALIIPRILGEKENIIIGEIDKAASHAGVHLDNFVQFFGQDKVVDPTIKTLAIERATIAASNKFYSKEEDVPQQVSTREIEEATLVIQQRTRGWLSKRDSSVVVIQAQARGQIVRKEKEQQNSATGSDSFYSKIDKKPSTVVHRSFDFEPEQTGRNSSLVSQSLNDQSWTRESQHKQQNSNEKQRAHDILQQYFDKGGSVNAMLEVLASMMEGESDMAMEEKQGSKSRDRRTNQKHGEVSEGNDTVAAESKDGQNARKKMERERHSENRDNEVSNSAAQNRRREKQERHKERSRRKGRRRKEHDSSSTANSSDSGNHDADHSEKSRSRSRSRSPDKNSRKSPKGSPKASEKSEKVRSTNANPIEDDALGSLLGSQAQEKSSAQIRYQERATTAAIVTAARSACVAAHHATTILERLPTFELLSGAEINSSDSNNKNGPSSQARSEGDEEAYGYSDDEFEIVKSVRFSNHVQVEYMPPYIYEERKQLFFQSDDYTRFCQEGEEERLKQQQAENLRALQEKMRSAPATTGEDSEYDF